MKKLIIILAFIMSGISARAQMEYDESFTFQYAIIEGNITSMSDAEYLEFALIQSIELRAKEITDFYDSTFQYIITASAFDTLGFMFPAREIITKKFYVITSQEDRDSIANNSVLNSLTLDSRAGHNFWFNNLSE